MTTTTKAFGVELIATFHVDKDRIAVDISVVNRSSAPVYLTDFSVDVATGKAFEESLFVEYEAPATAILTRRVLPLPPNVSFTRPPTVYLNRVAPGETHENTLRTRLPLRVPSAQRKDPDVECSVIRFELGVIAESQDVRPKAINDQGRTWYELGVAVAHRAQHVVKAETAEFKVPLVSK